MKLWREIAAATALTLAAIAFAPGAAAQGAQATLGDIRIEAGWTRATPPNAPSAVGYLAIANTGAAPDRLVAASSPRAERVEIHEMTMDGDTMRMRPVGPGLDIPAGGTVTLAPGGLHLMLIGVGGGFREGETVPVTLAFEKAGAVTLDLPVARLGAREPPAHGTHGRAHGGAQGPGG